MTRGASGQTLSHFTQPFPVTMDGSGSPYTETGGDGAVDRIWKRNARPVAAIFIHAGAGYHSTENEKVHLDACSEAARIGMKFLKAGSGASEAVEAAIRSLEDKEITNAGFGSNLNMDGVVECDATLVDHLGRSGACGAVPGIKNPISLAKLILDASNQPLSLRRVPPNILVGVGAKQFAEEHGMPSIRNEFLVSKNAKDRFTRWSEDLRRAEAKMLATAAPCGYADADLTRTPTPSEYEKAAAVLSTSQRRDHASAILTGTWNEGQPDSPYRGRTPTMETGNPMLTAAAGTPPALHMNSTRSSPSPLSFMSSFPGRTHTTTSKRPKTHQTPSNESIGQAEAAPHDSAVESRGARSHSYETAFPPLPAVSTRHDRRKRKTTARPSPASGDGSDFDECTTDADPDRITDTVGAIAIDSQGNIAAGSSSGGIGMKHSGRIGPAALVGIGTAVVPEDPADDEARSVAAVTSGTGEHMATSLASARCAERLFHGARRGAGGRHVNEDDDHALMNAFVVDDFMGHPGVRNQTSPGAIGVMAVKKCRAGIYFYFAHNTDSFALASMTATEREPVCVMSRLGQSGDVAQGARKISTS